MTTLSLGIKVLSGRCLLAACLWSHCGCAPAQQLPQSAEASQSIAAPHTNRLIDETSPYLLQHAHNPVDWYPWGAEAFAKAQAENKPIFLSVGYSTCYWCHVMERESFEREEVAQLLNAHFVCIKVDREERPEIDQQFMLATQLIVGRGGWPNSLWLTSDGRPWMAGTYFPRDQFKSVLQQLADAWEKRQPEIQQQADALTASIKRIGLADFQSKPVTQELLDQAVASTRDRYDATHGGFSAAPKFPPHAQLALLVDQFRRHGDQQLLDMIDGTLTHMSRGGIFDQLGGGFHRYATDEHWLLPHFEKMLYDNGQLIKAYTDGFMLTGNVAHQQTVERIFQWLKRDMMSPAGAFYSAIDSESSGQEGKYYVWTHAEILRELGQANGTRFAKIYNVLPEGNFKEESTGHISGDNVLHLQSSIAQLAEDYDVTSAELEKQLATQRAQLLSVRSQRDAPIRDDKVIAGWNGLMIESLAYAGRELNNPSYITAAQQAADFILEKMIIDGELHRTARAGEVKFAATLEDYAFVAAAFIELYRASAEQQYLTAARQLAERVLGEFDDPAGGGFYFTAQTSTQATAGLVIRAKNMSDGGNLPSGNGVMTRVLFDLAELTDEPRYAAAAKRNLSGLSGYLWRSAGVADSMLIAAAHSLAQNAPKSQTSATETADATFTATAIQGEVFLSQLKLAPGDTFRLAVRCAIDPAWHLYGPNPGVEFVRPTTLEIAKSSVFEVISLELPMDKLIHDRVLDRQLRTYTGTATFQVDLQIASDAAPGPAEVELSINSQACDARQCAQPEQTQVKLRISIVPPSQSADTLERHPHIFAK